MEENSESAFEINFFTFDNKKLRIVLDHLARFKKKVSKAVDDQKCYDYLTALHLVSYSPKINLLDMNIYMEKKAYSLFASYLNYFASICDDIDFPAFVNDQNNTDLNRRRINVLYFIARILNTVISRSSLFTIEFNQTVGLKALLSFFEHEKCLKSLCGCDFKDETDLTGILLSDINWLSKCSDENKQVWTNIKAANTLLNAAKYINQERNLLILYQTITNLVDDKQIENDSTIHKCFDILINFFQLGSDRLRNGFCAVLEKEFYIDNVISKQKVHCFKVEKSSQTLVGILQALYRLAINETMRYQIYESENFKQHILVYFSKGKAFEVRCVLSLLAQISFTPKLAMDLSKEEKIMESINKIINSENNESGDELHLKQISKNIKWNIETNQSQEKSATEVVPESPLKESIDEEKSRHVMISYNTASRDLCIRVKQQLESFGFKIWIDVSDIHGSSLAAMANAVEMSYCVLMCVTEKYRTSINCQAEAQYAFKLNKPIIPLIMQQGYENVTGWLGIIIGDKIFINFMKYEFDECLRRLKNELDNCVKVKISPEKELSPPKNNNNPKRKADDWDENMVSKWFIENELNREIERTLEPCSGEILKQMYDMKCRAPEFYYQSLKEIKSVDLGSITRFSAHLDKIFKETAIK